MAFSSVIIFIINIQYFAVPDLERQAPVARDLPPDAVDKLRAMLTFLQDVRDPEKLRALPLWKAHQLTGDRQGVWALHVTRNWRLTFQIRDGEIVDVDYEDLSLRRSHADAKPCSSWPLSAD